MQILLAVIDDLWQFLWHSLFGGRTVTAEDAQRELQAPLPLLSSGAVPALTRAPKEPAQLRPGEQYFIGELDTFLYSDPVIAFDTGIKKLPYGQSVLVKKIGGRWAEVVASNQPGWVLKDVLRERREDIHPKLVPDEMYTADNPETIKLRACIDDAFGAGRAELPLTAAEYVTYALAAKKQSISWPADGPRIPGTWQKRLRGQPGIHISITPSTGSVMEYIIEDQGYLAFVEAVFPDQSIKLTQVDEPEVGQFSQRMMSREEYRELRPVFIQVV